MENFGHERRLRIYRYVTGVSAIIILIGIFLEKFSGKDLNMRSIMLFEDMTYNALFLGGAFLCLILMCIEETWVKRKLTEEMYFIQESVDAMYEAEFNKGVENELGGE